MKYFYGHFLPSADSRRAVVSFWRQIVHKPLREQSLLSKSVVGKTGHARHDPIWLTGP